MPLERAEERGNVLLDEFGAAHVFGDHEKAELAVRVESRFGSVTYLSHHATCPARAAWKGVRRGDPGAPIVVKEEPAQGELLGPAEAAPPRSALLGDL